VFDFCLPSWAKRGRTESSRRSSKSFSVRCTVRSETKHLDAIRFRDGQHSPTSSAASASAIRIMAVRLELIDSVAYIT